MGSITVSSIAPEAVLRSQLRQCYGRSERRQGRVPLRDAQEQGIQ